MRLREYNYNWFSPLMKVSIIILLYSGGLSYKYTNIRLVVLPIYLPLKWFCLQKMKKIYFEFNKITFIPLTFSSFFCQTLTKLLNNKVELKEVLFKKCNFFPLKFNDNNIIRCQSIALMHIVCACVKRKLN